MYGDEASEASVVNTPGLFKQPFAFLLAAGDLQVQACLLTTGSAGKLCQVFAHLLPFQHFQG